MDSKRKYSRKDIIEKALRVGGLAALTGLAGYLGVKNILNNKACRDYSRCETCRDTSNCSLVTKEEVKSKWLVKESRNGRK